MFGYFAQFMHALRRVEVATRVIHPDSRDALERRWAALPEHVKTPAQVLGRAGVGCEGTQGVFPRCNFACKPCYHARDANRVRVDGAHTLSEITKQMHLLRTERGAFAHAQLIGGEVSLLDPNDHARALQIMRAHGREPMSFTHGDFDERYLRDLALDEHGHPRFRRLSFAAHFDTTMVGRRGLKHADRESDLDPYRARFCAMFQRLRREHGIRFYLAHNMTVTPANVHEIPDLIKRCRGMGFSLFSFHPAAFVGDDRRWNEDYRVLEADAVWEQIGKGAGTDLPYRLFEFGDTRCNRTAWGAFVGERWHSFLDQDDPRDLVVRDAVLKHFGGLNVVAPLLLVTVRVARVLAVHPSLVPMAFGWLRRFVRRAGGPVALLRHRPRFVTFVMHRFMHAEDVTRAWALMERGETSDDPKLIETQQRLSACSYGMAHPETGQIVPACVQHSVLDPAQNSRLSQLLPISRRLSRQPANDTPPLNITFGCGSTPTAACSPGSSRPVLSGFA